MRCVLCVGRQKSIKKKNFSEARIIDCPRKDAPSVPPYDTWECVFVRYGGNGGRNGGGDPGEHTHTHTVVVVLHPTEYVESGPGRPVTPPRKTPIYTSPTITEKAGNNNNNGKNELTGNVYSLVKQLS